MCRMRQAPQHVKGGWAQDSAQRTETAAQEGTLMGEVYKVGGDKVVSLRLRSISAFSCSSIFAISLTCFPELSYSSHSLCISFCPFEWILNATLLYTLITHFCDLGQLGQNTNILATLIEVWQCLFIKQNSIAISIDI